VLVIPEFSQSGVLPPFLPGATPTDESAVAPYKVELIEFVKHFSTSPERKKIILGYLNYRIKLKEFGVINGFQWIDGSFVENIEITAERPPNDIDLVTFAQRPNSYTENNRWAEEVSGRPDLFHPKESKIKYLCDAYFVDFSLPPTLLVSRTRYWFGLFSHRRDSYIWKGMLEINLSDNEQVALDFLNQGGLDAS